MGYQARCKKGSRMRMRGWGEGGVGGGDGARGASKGTLEVDTHLITDKQVFNASAAT